MPETIPTIHIDGAARGNPGPAAYAFVLRQTGSADVEVAATMGKATNNVAEYTALVKALEHARKVGIDAVEIYSDSELLVKQMKGQYRVKNADLKTLYDAADKLRKQFQKVNLTHVRRADNPDADRLCNLALDGKLGASDSPMSVKPRPRIAITKPPEAVAEEAIALLNASAKSWAKSGTDFPPAVDVWEQLWDIMQRHGVSVAKAES